MTLGVTDTHARREAASHPTDTTIVNKAAIAVASLFLLSISACDSHEDELAVDLLERGASFTLEIDNFTEEAIDIDVDCRSNVAPGTNGTDSFRATVEASGVLDRELDLLELPAELATLTAATCTVKTPRFTYEVSAGTANEDTEFRNSPFAIYSEVFEGGGRCRFCDPANAD